MITAREELYSHLNKLVTNDEANKMINELLEEHNKVLNETLCDLGDTHFDITSGMNRGQYARIIQSALS